MEFDDLVAGHGTDGRRRPRGRRAIGRPAERHPVQHLRGQRARFAQGDGQGVDGPGPAARHFRLGIGRTLDHIGEHGSGLVGRGHGRGQKDGGRIRTGSTADVGAQCLQRAGDLGGRAFARPLGGQAGRHRRQSRPPGRIAGRPAGHDQLGIHDRQVGRARDDDPQAVRQRPLDHPRHRHGADRARGRRGHPLALGQQFIGRQDGRGDRQIGRHRGRVSPAVLGHAGGPGALVLIADRDPRLIVQIRPRHALHVGGGHGLDGGQPGVRRAGIILRDDRLTQDEGSPRRRLALAQFAGHDLGLGLGQFGGGHRLVAHPRQLGVQRRLYVNDGLPARHRGGDGDRAVLLHGISAEAGVRGQLRAIDQRLVQARTIAARQDPLQHVQRCVVGMVRGHAGIEGTHRRQRHIRRIAIDGAGGRARRLDGPDEHRHRTLRVRNVGEILVDPAVQLGRIEIARDDHRRRRGTVISLVEGPGVLDHRRVQLLDRADDTAAIDAFVKAVVADHEALEPAIGRGQHPLAQLFLDDRAFRLEHGLIDHRPRHPLGVGPQHRLQILRRHRLVIVGEILPRRRIARPSGILDQGRDLAIRQVDRLAAEDVFEQVGEAAAPLRIVLAADIVPEGHRHRAGRGVRHRINVQPVGQLTVRVLQRRDRDRGRRGGRCLGQGGPGGERCERQKRGSQKGGGACHVGGPRIGV